MGVNSPKTNALYSPLFKRLVDNPLSSISTSCMIHCEGVRKELCACSWPVKISSWKINTDAAACYWLFLFADGKIGQRTGFQWQSCCYTVLSSERRHKERWMPHHKEQRRERERNGVRWHAGCDFCFSRDWDDCKLFSWLLWSAKTHLCWYWWFLTNPISIINWLCFSKKLRALIFRSYKTSLSHTHTYTKHTLKPIPTTLFNIPYWDVNFPDAFSPITQIFKI